MKKLILDAAMQLFKKNGFEEISIRKIADIIEYSPTTIYLHFSSKDEILYALHEQGFHLLDKVFEPLLEIKDPIERIQKFGEDYMNFGLSNPEYYDLMFLQNGPLDALMKEGEEEWKSGDHAFAYLVQATQEVVNQHPKVGVDPLTMAYALWSMVHGFVTLQLTDRLCWYSDDLKVKEQAGFLALQWISALIRKS